MESSNLSKSSSDIYDLHPSPPLQPTQSLLPSLPPLKPSLLSSPALPIPPPSLQNNDWTFEEIEMLKHVVATLDYHNLDNYAILFKHVGPNVPKKLVENLKTRYHEVLIRNSEAIKTNKGLILAQSTPTKQRRKAWSKLEHLLFMIGYRICGNHWTNISKSFVRSRTPKQLASHGQFYMKRLAKENSSSSKSLQPPPPQHELPNDGAQTSKNLLQSSCFSTQPRLITNSTSTNSSLAATTTSTTTNHPIIQDEEEEDFLDLDNFPNIFD